MSQRNHFTEEPDALPAEAYPGGPHGDRTEFWAEGTNLSARSRGALEALRAYRQAERAMRAKLQNDMDMGEKDVEALRILLESRASHTPMRPKDLGEKLEITNASASALVNRLINSGAVERHNNVRDRRSHTLVVTTAGEAKIRANLAIHHRRIREVVRNFSDEELSVVEKFLTLMTHAINDAQ